MEYLRRGLQHTLSLQQNRFFVSAGIPVPYLAFADDMLIFARCSKDCLMAIQEFLAHYQAVSGQRVNVSKSSFFLSSKAIVDQVQVASSILGFQKDGFPCTYLGAPLYKGRTCSTSDALEHKNVNCWG